MSGCQIKNDNMKKIRAEIYFHRLYPTIDLLNSSKKPCYRDDLFSTVVLPW